MYSSVDSRSSNPHRGQGKPSKPSQPLAVSPRWALNLSRIRMACTKPAGDSHTVKPISMRDDVTALQRKHKGESVDSAVHYYLRNRAWQAIIAAVQDVHGQGGKHYAGSMSLADDVHLITNRFKDSYKQLVVVSHAKANQNQHNSLIALLRQQGFQVTVEMSPCEVFATHSLVIGNGEFITSFATLDYYMEGPMSVPDTEGNDVQWRPHFKVDVNQSGAVGVIAWKNYNSFSF